MAIKHVKVEWYKISNIINKYFKVKVILKVSLPWFLGSQGKNVELEK